MQKPIRYYITKSGEEPTVRSVRVALGSNEAHIEPETSTAPYEPTAVARHAPTSAAEVTRRVKDAFRRREAER
jgi:hypothetical protein